MPVINCDVEALLFTLHPLESYTPHLLKISLFPVWLYIPTFTSLNNVDKTFKSTSFFVGRGNVDTMLKALIVEPEEAAVDR
jgi:hypothetical protein